MLHSPFAQGTNREKASVGAAFALAACGFLPLFLLPSGALRVKLSLLGNKYVPHSVRVDFVLLTVCRLCLTASVFGLMNMVIHLAYGMIRSVMLLTALALAVSQVVCYVAVIWVRVGRKGRPMPMGSVLTPRDRRDHRDRPGELLSELVLKDGGSPQERLSNLEERHIRL